MNFKPSHTTTTLQDLFEQIQNNMGHLTASEELKEYNIISEMHGLAKFLKLDLEPKDRLFKQARYDILSYILTCVKNDPENGDYYSDENMALLRKAGEMLYEEKGMDSMRDFLVWSFIPKRYHGDINHAWDGIGDWKA